MKVLKLGNNMLHTLDQDLFEHLGSLEVLSLELNPFKVIDIHTETAISGLLHLQVRASLPLVLPTNNIY